MFKSRTNRHCTLHCHRAIVRAVPSHTCVTARCPLLPALLGFLQYVQSLDSGCTMPVGCGVLQCSSSHGTVFIYEHVSEQLFQHDVAMLGVLCRICDQLVKRWLGSHATAILVTFFSPEQIKWHKSLNCKTFFSKFVSST